MTAVCTLWNRQIPLQQPAEWHDLDLYRTIDCATVLVSDDFNSLVCAVSLFLFVCWWQQCVLCEIDRNLGVNKLSGTISTFIGQLTALKELWVTITIVSFALSLCSCSCANNISMCFVKSTETSATTSWMARSRPLLDSWLRCSTCERRLQLFRLRCLSVPVRVLITALCALWNQQTPLQQPADWHDSFLDRTIDFTQSTLSAHEHEQRDSAMREL